MGNAEFSAPYGDRFKRFSGFILGPFPGGTLLVVFRRHTLFLIRLVMLLKL
jgi:hypothetical protein